MHEEFIINRLKNGDRTAFDEIYNLYVNQALRTAFLITGNKMDSEDIVQQTFIKCYQTIGQLKDVTKFKSWFFRILTRIAWKTNKNKLPCVDKIFDSEYTSSKSSLDIILENEQNQILYHAINSLDTKLKAVIILYYYNELSIKEISDVLCIRQGTVKSRLFSARKKLQNYFSDYQSEGVLL